MALCGNERREDRLIVAVGIGLALVLGVLHVLRDPLLHPDGALAQRTKTRLWMTRPSWIRGCTVPAEARAVGRPCGGTFVLFELGAR